MKCIVLAGGTGDGLWPLSRKNFPKQFISNQQGVSSFQETVMRNIPFCDEFIIITNQKYEMIVLGQLKQFQGIEYRIILETDGLGTAGAIALIPSVIDQNEMVMVLPADAFIDQDGYADSVVAAKMKAERGVLCLLGVLPRGIRTEYGYIKHGNGYVEKFYEKPSVDMAKALSQQENVLWNTGIVFGIVKCFEQELSKYGQELLETIQKAVKNGKYSEHNSFIIASVDYDRISFDKLILEKSENIWVVQLKSKWNAFNDFEFLKEAYTENTIQNLCTDTDIINEGEGQLIVANGLDNLFIVNTADAILVSHKTRLDDVRNIMFSTYEKKREYYDNSPLIYRPWGTRQLIQKSDGYRVRKIVIYPGMKLSRHIHRNRYENYMVISGTLTIELQDEIIELEQNASYNVVPGMKHRLRNNTDDIVIAIEVDTGKLIDENDMLEIDEGDDLEQRKELPFLYKLEPAFKDYLWGGNNLVERYGKKSPYDITAESWELSAHPDGSSTISGGPMDGMLFRDFVNIYGSKVCGWKSHAFDRFPILIKFIDASNSLSVQIHPDDDYALINENEFGKSEMWYIMDCKEGAFLYCGLKKETTKEEIRERISNETLTEILNAIPVKKGDVVFVPSGTIHAIGEGILICEIQQNSNCTYRMYDYGRRDKNGRLRDLHVDKALDVVHLEPYYPDTQGFGTEVKHETSTQRILSRCKYFQVIDYKISEHEIIQVDEASFKAIVVVEGRCTITCGHETYEAMPGESFFVRAGRKRIHIDGECEVIVTNI